jgi:fatty acid desaturase
MSDRRPPELDLLPDGSYRPRRPPVAARIFAWAIVIAVVAGALAFAAFALWIALLLIPVVVVAGLIAWLAFRYQVWRAGQRGWRTWDGRPKA